MTQSIAEASMEMSRENSIGSLSNDNKEISAASVASSSNHAYEDDRCSLDSSSRYQHEVLCDGGSGSTQLDDVYVFDIDKQKLIEKMVKLQKKLAKSNEKIDFMQDHINQLTNDLKRKTR